MIPPALVLSVIFLVCLFLDELVYLLFGFLQILAAVEHHAYQLHNFVELLISHDFCHSPSIPGSSRNGAALCFMQIL